MAKTLPIFNMDEFRKEESSEKRVVLPIGTHKGLITSINGTADRILINLETLDNKPIKQVASFYMHSEEGRQRCKDFLSEMGGYNKNMGKNIDNAIGKEVKIIVTENQGYLNANVYAPNSAVLAEQPKKRRTKKVTTTVEVVEEPETVRLSDEDLESLGF